MVLVGDDEFTCKGDNCILPALDLRRLQLFHLYQHTKFHDKWISSFRGVAMTSSFISIFYVQVPRDITPTKMRGSKFPADMHNTI